MNPSYAGVLGSPRSRKRRWPRIVLWSFAGVLALAVVAVAAGVFWLRSAEKAALPTLDGDLHINGGGTAGLSAPVTVRRDQHGVPHIEAATEGDLFVAQGYVTAQDRLWQMDSFRRNANGDLAEILGSSLVKHDTAQRVLQFRRTAERVYANLPAADRQRLDDYARGVNLFIDQHRDALPAEFRLLHYTPKPWTGADSLSIGMMMVEMLDSHWDVKLAREEIAADLHNPKLEADLYPVGSWRDHPPTGTVVDLSQPHPEPPAKTDSNDDDDDRSQASVASPGPGTGPRIGPGIDRGSRSPTLFAESAKRMGHGANTAFEDVSATIAGATKFRAPSLRLFPGARVGNHEPQSGFTPVAHEDFAALRATLGLPDCPNCTPGSNNWVVAGSHTASGKPLLANDMHLPLTEPNIWFMADLAAPGFHAAGVTLPGVPFIIAGHNEHVAWGFTALYADVQDLYLENLDGKGNYQAGDGSWKPLAVDHEVIHVRGGKNVNLDVQFTAHGPLMGPLFKQQMHPFSLKWTLYDPTLNALPLYQMNTAANWSEFSAALRDWCWPTQNVVYSDDQGHIAYHAVGRVPLRPAGLQGLPIHDAVGAPKPREWQGYIAFDQMPSSVDPPSGFLATANSRVTTESSPYPLSLEWVDPYRIQRIYKALQGRDKLTPPDMLAVQTDIYSEVDQEIGQRLAYAIDHTPAAADPRLRQAADLMRSWDGKLTTDSAASSIVTKARSALWPMILEPKLGKDAADYRWSESDFAEEEIIMHGSPDGSNAWLPPAYKNWDALLTDAVRKGMEDGKAPSDVAFWRYGSWHVVDIEHPLAAYLPIIGRIAGTGPQPLSGDTTTVKQVGRDFGPSQRFTMDWSNIDGSTEDIVLGESSDPYSPYFSDQWNDYYGGTTFALPFTPAAVTAATQHTLRLLP
jgi:penicillin amidase